MVADKIEPEKPMLTQDQSSQTIWLMLEELYLESTTKLAQGKYKCLSDTEKRTALMNFAKQQVSVSKRWAEIFRDLLAIDRNGS